MNNSLLNLFSIQLKRFYREPEIIFWTVFFPIMMSWILGIAFSGDTIKLQTIAVVSNHSSIDKILPLRQPKTTFKILYTSEEEAVTMLKRGLIPLYIKIENNGIVYLFDKNDSEAVLAYLKIENMRLINSSSSTIANVKHLTAQGIRYIDFLIPGLIALGIMNSCIWGIGWGLVELRIRKLIRRMAATPMKKSYFIASHFLARLVPTGIETAILYTFAHFYFGFILSGSLIAFILIFLSGIFAFSGIGFLISSRTASTDMANGLINVITIPLAMVSGIFFSYHNFPIKTAEIIKYLPLTMLVDSIRSIFNQGAGVKEVFFNVIILFSQGLFLSIIGLKIFKWH